ncbi:40984_t:CDS:2, partial [Gigaspora margarita]
LLVWWQEKQYEYPKLSLIAKDYLCIQATSVFSEQAFSITGQTITALRNRLDGFSSYLHFVFRS